MVEGMGEVVWADDAGRAGMLFSHLTPASRKYLKQWFVKQKEKKPSRALPRGQKDPSRRRRVPLEASSAFEVDRRRRAARVRLAFRARLMILTESHAGTEFPFGCFHG